MLSNISKEKSIVEAIIFDCDGVLVNTEHLKYLAWKNAFKKYGVHFTLQDYLPLVGQTSRNILNEVKKTKELSVKNDFDIIQEKNNLYQIEQKKGVSPILPTVNLVKKLSKQKSTLNIKLAVASSAPLEEININLNQIGLSNVFDKIISGHDHLKDIQDLDGVNKPKPYIYIRLAEWLNVDPKNCLVFEDTAAGAEAAYKANMIVIAVQNEYTMNQNFKEVNRVVHELSEHLLHEFLLGGNL
jgi:HAD superfamily hydrolase (TIGR01509 family)